MVVRSLKTFLVVAGAAWLCSAAVGCSPVQPAAAADEPPSNAIAVQLGAVGRGELQRRIRASGTLYLKSEADLSFKVGGVVTRVAVDAGSRVRRGQVLATV